MRASFALHFGSVKVNVSLSKTKTIDSYKDIF